MLTKDHQNLLLRTPDIVIAYTLLRLVMGINIFVHGLVRIGDIPGFVQSQVALYEEIAIPDFMIAGPAFLIPIIELIAGFLMIIGLETRNALIAGFGLMLPLMFGVCLLQNWSTFSRIQAPRAALTSSTAGSQLIYCLVYFALLVGYPYNRISIDQFRHRS